MERRGSAGILVSVRTPDRGGRASTDARMIPQVIGFGSGACAGGDRRRFRRRVFYFTFNDFHVRRRRRHRDRLGHDRGYRVGVGDHSPGHDRQPGALRVWHCLRS